MKLTHENYTSFEKKGQVLKAKDQVEFSESIQTLSDEDLEKVREILLSKEMTDDNMAKLKHVDIAIESRERHRRYMDKL